MVLDAVLLDGGWMAVPGVVSGLYADCIWGPGVR